MQSELRTIEHISEDLDAKYHQMQHFITESNWDERAVIDQVSREVSSILPKTKLTVLILDESGWVKKGDKSVGVGRLYCGNVGKISNSQVAVFGCLSNGNFASMVDARLYLPQDWCNDPDRCTEAGIPDQDRKFKTKLNLTLDIIHQQVSNRVCFDYVGAEGFYGNDANLAKEIDKMGYIYMLDNPGQGAGMLLRLQSELAYCTMSFYSSEHTDPAKRPRLELTYSWGGKTLTLTNNFIYSLTPQVALADPAWASEGDLTEEVVYFDGLGRPMQKNLIANSPGWNDVIVPIAYDSFGREDTTYLPYATTVSASGAFNPNAIDDAYSANCEHYKFYNTHTNSVVNDTKPFAKTEFEPSPLNRVLKQGAPGLTWQPNTVAANDHSVKLDYGTNIAGDNVRMWTISAQGTPPNSSGSYLVNTLYKTTTWDENNPNDLLASTSRTEEYKDKQGKVVLKRSYNLSEILSTYYVYDDFEMLRVVIPPMANGDGGIVPAGVLADLCYQYTYDSRKRMTIKKLPGADPVYLVYDNRNRLVATQDGVQRAKSPDEWTFLKYDALDRPVMTGVYKVADNTAPGTVQATVEGFVVYNEDRLTTGYGYTNNSFPKLTGTAPVAITEADILTLTYYDTYGFPGIQAFDMSASNISGYNEGSALEGSSPLYFEKLIGPVTGPKTKVLETNTFLISTNYYDDRYRMIQGTRSLYDGFTGTETIYSKFDFVGKVVQTKQTQNFYSAVSTKITTTVDKYYAYDHAGRLAKTDQQISGDANGRVVAAENSYNEIGQLIDKKLHKTVSNNFLQSVDYSYNIRGWLTSINNPDNLTALQAGDANIDLFGEKLLYQTTESGLNSGYAPQFNGNISAMAWNTTQKTRQGYAFAYDGLNRFKMGDHKYFTSAWTDNTNYDEGGVVYDKNGNIQRLIRTDNTGINLFIYYFYSGNQLATINGGAAYAYDKNGNSTFDGRRGVSVDYNMLNLPKTISKGSENIAYIYSAAGEKLAKRMTNGTYKYYAGNMVYNKDRLLDYLLFEEGMVTKTSNLYSYEYHMKDHLGNTRVAFQPNGPTTTTTQVAEYYPFGSSYLPVSPIGTNKYLYNGKEKQDDVLSGIFLDLYDYGARFYDPSIGRWHSVDPMADQAPDWSPYRYGFNNPIIYTDPTGMFESTHTDEDGNVIAVYNDGDLGVYKHEGKGDEAKKDINRNHSKKNVSAGGDKMGETEHWDEFVNPETGKTMTGTQIQFGQSWEGPIAESAFMAKNMNLKEIASKSGPKQVFDLKYHLPNQGRLLKEKYASARSAGNYLAGFNASMSNMFGVQIQFETFQRLAGALHVHGNLTKLEMLDIVVSGFKYGPAPAYGENIYQYRMSKSGWDDSRK